MPSLFLLVQAAGAACLILVLFRFRKRLGLAPIFVTVGAFQYLQVVLANTVWFELFSGLSVSPGSVVLFPASLFTFLLVYALGSYQDLRRLAFGVIGANLVIAAVSWMAGAMIGGTGETSTPFLPPEMFAQDARIMLIGTAVLAVDLPLAVWLYRRFGQVQSNVVRLAATSSIVLAFDAVAFTLGGFHDHAQLGTILLAAVVGKVTVACFYSLVFGTYIRLSEPLDLELGEMIRICASCKNGCDDEGVWRPIDAYLSSRLGLQFTHGICPACVAKDYPGLDTGGPPA